MNDKKYSSMKNIKDLMIKGLQNGQMVLLNSIAEIADRERVNVYVVGGFVRDLLLNIHNLDIDLSVEGDGIGFAEILAKEFNGFARSHVNFGTSVVVLKDQSRIDVAMARMESYPFPGSLPKVKRSSIKMDLFRRDFTLNSMAIKLNGKGAFCLIDLFNGEKDLKDCSIRVLHDKSFIDDPCRIFRAIRFEQRLDFCIEDQTKDYMEDAIKSSMINQLSGARIMNELKLLLSEPVPFKCINRMRELSLFNYIAPSISNDDSSWLMFKKLDGILNWADGVPMLEKPKMWLVYLSAFFFTMEEIAFEKSMKHLDVPLKMRHRLRSDRIHLLKAKPTLCERRELKPSEIYDIFSELSSEAVIVLLAICSNEHAKECAILYFSKYYISAKPELTSVDLVDMGMEPGPIFKAVFKALREARVNGQVKSRDEEVILVESLFMK